MAKDGRKAVVVAGIGLAIAGVTYALTRPAEAVPPEPPLPGFATVYGIVTCAKTGNPLSGVSASLWSPDESELIGDTVTNGSGSHSLADILPGSYVLYFQKGGFETQFFDIVLTEGLRELNVQMVPVAPPIPDEQNLRELAIKQELFERELIIGDWQSKSQARMMLIAIELYRTGAPAGEIYKYLNVSEGVIDKPEHYLVGGNVPLMTAETWQGMFDAYRAWSIEITESWGFEWSPEQEAALVIFFQEKIIDNTKQKLGKSRLKGWDY